MLEITLFDGALIYLNPLQIIEIRPAGTGAELTTMPAAQVYRALEPAKDLARRWLFLTMKVSAG